MRILFFYSYQYGFLPKCSTETAVFNVVALIQETLDQKKLAACLFIDLNKAFDTANHGELMKKLYSAGIRMV